MNLIDLARRQRPMAKHKWNPGGEKGKLHRELGIPEGEKIPQERLSAATRSDNPEIRRDAIRARTMEGWHHGGAERRYKKMKG
jgi:hypothetical protein